LSLFRRREPLHVRLAREGEIALTEQPDFQTPPPWHAAGIHGVQRTREWDAVTTVSAPELEGERIEFVALAGDRLVPVGGGEGDLHPLAVAIDRDLAPPYRAEAVRRDTGLWAVAARRIEVVRLPNTAGREIELTSHEGERTLLVDGERTFGTIPQLERDQHVVRATWIADDAWEVEFHPL
jgi:hypothetical protein